MGNLTGNVTGNTSGTAATVTTAAQPNITSLGTLTTLTVDDMTLNGSTISDASDLTLDLGGDLIIDVDGDNVWFDAAGTRFLSISQVSSDVYIGSEVQDKDIIFRGNDGGSTITALTLDMSAAGAAIFNGSVTANAGVVVDELTIDADTITATDDFIIDAVGDITLDAADNQIFFKDAGTTVGTVTMTDSNLKIISNVSDKDLVLAGTDGGSEVVALTLDMSEAGAATFNNKVVATELDISGNADIDGTLEADAYTVDGTALNEYIADTVGAMVGSNTETGISVSYEDGDNTLDFVIGAGSIVNSMLADDAVGADELAANSVVSASIVNGSIVGADIADNTIATANIADNAVDATKIASNSILTRHVDDNQITGDQLADDLVLSGTGAIRMPDGTTAQRPGSPAAGMFRYNTTDSKFEGYTDSWGEIGGGGSNTFTYDSMTGDGSDTTLALSQTPGSEDNLMVFIDGVYQQKDAYTLSGTTLTFADAPVSGRKVVAYSIKSSVSGDGLNVDNFSGDGSDTTFTLSLNPVHENNTQVYIDGVYQFKNTYAVSGTTLTFSTAPPNGSAIEVMTHSQTTINNFPATGISSLTEVAPVSGDMVMIHDATDNALKKADVDALMAASVSFTSSADAVAMTFDSSENATFAGNIVTTGTKQIQFGDSGTYIHQSADGVLDLVSDTEIEINATTIDMNGALDLSGNATLGGTVTSGKVTASVTDNSDTIVATSTAADANAGPIVKLYRNSSSPADSDQLGNIHFYGRNDNSQDVKYAEIEAWIDDASDGTEDGILQMNSMINGTSTERLKFNASGANFNTSVILGDDTELVVGAGSDLKFYHSSNVNYIKTNSDLPLKIWDAGGAGILEMTPNGAVGVFHNGSEKVTTTSTGATVTGLLTATTSANVTQVALTSSSAAVAWDARAAANAYHVTTENTTFSAPSNATEGAIISVEIAQGGTARTIAWNTVFEFAASTAPTMTATANKTDIYSFRYNGSVWQEIGRVQNMAQT